MIDLTKVQLSLVGTFKEFVNNTLLDFHVQMNDSTGECFPFPKTALYKDLAITAKSESFILLNGSLHKYHNSGANDSFFNYNQLLRTITNICATFKIDAFKSKIQNVEFGVNLIVPFDVDEFLNWLVCYKQCPFSIESDENKTYHVCKRKRYWIKVYNKGKQYNRSDNVLRFEIKVIKMKHIEFTGIEFLSDLLDKKKLSQLGNMLNQVFSEIIYTDMSINPEQLSDREKLIFANGNNPLYWQQLTTKQRYKKKIEFRKLLNSHGNETYFSEVKKMIPEMWEQLLYNKTGDVLTDFEYNFLTDQRGRFNSLGIGLNHSLSNNTKERKCLTCGRDISTQKKGSKFCSEKYNGREVKKCRNKVSNPKNNFLRTYHRIFNGPQLFDSSQYLKLTPQQRDWIGL